MSRSKKKRQSRNIVFKSPEKFSIKPSSRSLLIAKILFPTSLLGFIISGFLHIYQYTQQEFSVLNIQIDHTINANEFLYQDCQNANYSEITNDIKKLKESTVALVDKHKAMGRLVSPETYCAIHKLTLNNNYIFSLSNNLVCQSSLLKGNVMLSLQKKDIEQKISHDRKSYRFSIKSSIKAIMGEKYETYDENLCSSP